MAVGPFRTMSPEEAVFKDRLETKTYLSLLHKASSNKETSVQLIKKLVREQVSEKLFVEGMFLRCHCRVFSLPTAQLRLGWLRDAYADLELLWPELFPEDYHIDTPEFTQPKNHDTTRPPENRRKRTLTTIPEETQDQIKRERGHKSRMTGPPNAVPAASSRNTEDSLNTEQYLRMRAEARRANTAAASANTKVITQPPNAVQAASSNSAQDSLSAGEYLRRRAQARSNSAASDTNKMVRNALEVEPIKVTTSLDNGHSLLTLKDDLGYEYKKTEVVGCATKWNCADPDCNAIAYTMLSWIQVTTVHKHQPPHRQ